MEERGEERGWTTKIFPFHHGLLGFWDNGSSLGGEGKIKDIDHEQPE